MWKKEKNQLQTAYGKYKSFQAVVQELRDKGLSNVNIAIYDLQNAERVLIKQESTLLYREH